MSCKVAGDTIQINSSGAVVHLLETALPARSGMISNTAKDLGSGRLTISSAFILEDNFTIAVDLEDMLRDLGIDDVVLTASLEDARNETERRTFDVYLLDINLGGTTSIVFAEELVSRGCYVVFTTGYSENSNLPDAIRSVPILDKPYSEATLLKHLHGVAQSSAAE